MFGGAEENRAAFECFIALSSSAQILEKPLKVRAQGKRKFFLLYQFTEMRLVWAALRLYGGETYSR